MRRPQARGRTAAASDRLPRLRSAGRPAPGIDTVPMAAITRSRAAAPWPGRTRHSNSASVWASRLASSRPPRKPVAPVSRMQDGAAHDAAAARGGMISSSRRASRSISAAVARPRSSAGRPVDSRSINRARSSTVAAVDTSAGDKVRPVRFLSPASSSMNWMESKPSSASGRSAACSVGQAPRTRAISRRTRSWGAEVLSRRRGGCNRRVYK